MKIAKSRYKTKVPEGAPSNNESAQVSYTNGRYQSLLQNREKNIQKINNTNKCIDDQLKQKEKE